MGILLRQFTVWKWEISNLVDGLSLHLVIAKVRYLLTWYYRPKYPLSTSLRWSKVFENRWNTFGDMGFLLRQCTCWKWKISNLVDGLSFHLVIAKVKYLLTWNFRPKYAISTSLRWTKVFENRWNTFGDIGFLLDQFTCWKWEISKYFRWAKFSPCHCKNKKKLLTWNFLPKFPLSTRMRWSKVFSKSAKYLWRYGIFAATVYRLKVGNFKSCRWAKFSPCHCKTKIPAHLTFSAQMPTFNIFEMKQSIWKSIKYLWRYRIFAGTVYRLKVGNFKSSRWAKFSPCLCKTKIPAHAKFSAQMPTFSTYEMKQSFLKSVKYLWRYRIFAGTVYMFESGKFLILSMG